MSSPVDHALVDACSLITAFQAEKAGIIDLDQLEDLRGIFGAEAFAKLFAKFGDDLRGRAETLDGTASRADVTSLVHGMISSAGSLGFTAFSDLCRAIERIAVGGGDLGPSIVAFTTASGHVLQTIASLTEARES